MTRSTRGSGAFRAADIAAWKAEKAGIEILRITALADAKAAADAYAKPESILKELSTPETVVEGSDNTPEGNAGKTTNDLPQGDKSPVGSTKNKIPSPVKGQK